MKRIFLLMILVSLVLGGTAFAQYTTFVVDDNGNPLTTYPTLAAAMATAQTFAGGPHKIVIMEGSYSDHSLVFTGPSMVDEIYGDPAAAPGTIVFTQPAGPAKNFMTCWNGLVSLKNFDVVGYGGAAFIGNGAAGLTIEDINIRGASGWGIDLSGTSGATVDGLSFVKLDKGIYGNGVTGATIQNLTFDSCTVGVELYNFTTGGVIDNLSVVRGTYGIYLDGGSTGAMVQNCTVDGMSLQGIYLNTVGGSRVENNLVTNCGAYGIYMLNSLGGNPNWVRFNCLINNTGGTSQGFDNVAADWWDQNYYSDNVYAQDGGAVTDANPKLYMFSATAAAASYNLDDVFTVDLNWTMPACAGLDSVQMAAFGFTLTYDPAKLQFMSAAYDQTLLGPAPPALYTLIDGATPGQVTFAAANFTTPGVNGARLATAQFKVIGANTTASFAFTNVDARDPANAPIPFGLGGLTLTLVDNVAPVMVSLTANNPAGDDTYSDGSLAGPGPFLKLYLTMSATDDYNLAEFQWNSNGGAWSPWVPVSGTSATVGPQQYDFVWLGLPEGTGYTAGVRVKDAGGNVSVPMYYTYNIDRTAPVITSVTLADADGCAVNANYTNAVGVTVNLVDDNTASLMEMVQVANPFTNVGSPYVNPASFTLTGTDGSKTVNVQLWDKYNNLSATAGDAIVLDRVAPVPTGWLLAGGAAKTNVPGINGTYTTAGSGAVQLAFSEDVDDLVCGSALWQALGSPKPVTLSANDEVKTVFFATRDNAGNISTPISDQIELDTEAPVLTSYDMRDRTTFSNDCSNNGLIRAYFSYTDDGDAVTLQWSYDGTTFGTWEALMPSPDSADGSVPAAPDGYKLLYIRLVDDIGNLSNIMVDSIYVDGTAPTLATVAAEDIGATASPDPIYPGGVTNATTFTIKLTGLSADVTALMISEDGGTNYTTYPVATAGAATFDYVYTWLSAYTGCTWYPVFVKTVDCAGNMSGAFNGNVYFDIPAPAITAFTGPALTNVLTVSLSITATDNCGLYQMRLGEGSLVGVPWIPFNAAPSFTLAAGDSNHTVNLEVSDYGGNLASASVVIQVDQTVPSAGTFTIVSGNILAAPSYTNSLTGNTCNIGWDADVTHMLLRNSNGTGNTGYIPVVAAYAWPSLALTGGDPGVRTIQYRFRDAANNIGPSPTTWYTATINFSTIAPPPPAAGSASGIPGGSCDLTWGAVADAKSYLIRFNFQNQYPIYPDPIPPHPANQGEGILAGTSDDTTFSFGGPQPDIYSFSIWTLSKHGIYSSSPNVDVTATNYILGDFDPTPNGCIDFGAEFGAMASAYNSIPSDPNWNAYLDIGPTIDNLPTGYPTTDQMIEFEDLVIFALNYDAHVCPPPTANDQPGENRQLDNGSAASSIAVEATIPSRINAGEEFTIPVKIDNFEAVKGYHVILSFNSDNFEIVKVEAGKAYESVAQSFFYSNQKSSNIDISGVVLGAGVTFADGELFRVTVRATNPSDINLSEVELTFRDRSNNDLAASLGVVKSVALPTAFALSQNYPNPFNPTTTIELSLPVASDYKLTIYNVLGQEVQTFEGHSEAGYKSVIWNASNVASGIYLYRVEAGSYTATKKMVLLK